jgi:hypothetical protein
MSVCVPCRSRLLVIAWFTLDVLSDAAVTRDEHRTAPTCSVKHSLCCYVTSPGWVSRCL